MHKSFLLIFLILLIIIFLLFRRPGGNPPQPRYPYSPPVPVRRHSPALFLKIEIFSVLRNITPNSTFMSQQAQLKAGIDSRLPETHCDDCDRLRHPPRKPLGLRIVTTL